MTDIDKSYLGNPNLKAANVKVEFTKDQVEEYLKCSKDPIYFMKNYIQIVSLDEGLVPFKLYDFQEDMVNKIHENRFVIAKLLDSLVNQLPLCLTFFIMFCSTATKMLPFLRTS